MAEPRPTPQPSLMDVIQKWRNEQRIAEKYDAGFAEGIKRVLDDVEKTLEAALLAVAARPAPIIFDLINAATEQACGFGTDAESRCDCRAHLMRHKLLALVVSSKPVVAAGSPQPEDQG